MKFKNLFFFFFQAEDGIRDAQESRGLGDVYKRQGHFVKMVHNAIEYGIMAAYAEGLNILHHANVGKSEQTVDAETTPLRHPELYQYDFNLADITELWRRGSAVSYT